MLTKEWGLSPIQAGLVGSSVYLGMMIGAYAGGVISDKLGRKIVFIFGMLIAVTFAFLSAFSVHVIMFVFCRFFSGIGLGSSVPTDISL